MDMRHPPADCPYGEACACLDPQADSTPGDCPMLAPVNMLDMARIVPVAVFAGSAVVIFMGVGVVIGGGGWPLC